jgi:poly(A) polymerase/tRNA nucleotidyltransferase (CCA-adding enzyme)
MKNHSFLREYFETFCFLPDLHVVGGAVRDVHFGLEPKDIDLVTSIPPKQVAVLVAERAWTTVEIGKEHGTLMVIHPNLGKVEVTTLRRDLSTNGRQATVSFIDSIEEDLARRDFTINSVAMRPDGTLVDPFGGVADMRARRLRFVRDPESRVREDYLRVMRGFRFARRYDLAVEAKSRAAILNHARDVPHHVSIQRIVKEVDAAFQGPNAGSYVLDLYSAGLLTHPLVVPELAGAENRRLNPGPGGEASVIEHVAAVVDRAPPTHRWHALLHDVGKIETARPSTRGPWHCFPDHEEVGARQVRAIATRLRMSRELMLSLEAIARHHSYPLRAAASGQVPSLAERRQFQAAVGVHLADLWVVQQAHGKSATPSKELFDPLPRGELEPVLRGSHLIEWGFRHAFEPASPDEQNFSDVLARAYARQLEVGDTDPRILLTWALDPPD